MTLNREILPFRRTCRPILAGAALTAFGTLLLLGAALFAGCKQEGAKGTVLAQVGNASLTLEELRESFPAEYEQLIRREQYLDFIKRWIDDEVLYQQALKGRLDDDPQVKRKLDKLMRKLLIEEFLARDQSAEAFEPDEMAMNQYYEMHKEEFRRKVPEIKFAHIRVSTPKQAADLRWKIQNDNAFLAQAAALSLDPVPEAIASLPYKKQTELPSCLAAEVSAARIGQNTNPIACPDGVYLVRIFDRQESGSLIPFAEAKDEISATLLMERKDKLMDARINQYKEGIAISYNLDQIPGLTEAPATPSAAQGDAASGSSAATGTGSSGPAAAAAPGAAAASAAAASAAASAATLETVATEPAPARPRPARRRPRPAAPPAGAPPSGAETAPVPSQPAASPPVSGGEAATAPAQEENANVQKPAETTP